MWPEKAEFVRAAAKFGAKIVPFCGVGEDDFLKVSTFCTQACVTYSWCDCVQRMQVVVDYNDQIKVPIVKEVLKRVTAEGPEVR